MKPPHKGKVAAVRESKAADMFAFGMLAVEVFTGNVPFVEQSNQEVVFQILGGVRPGMPENAKEVGLTAQMWKLITSCWQENPKKRPTIGEVVVRLREFVGRIDDGGDVVFECVSFNFIVGSLRSMIRPGGHNLRRGWLCILVDKQFLRLWGLARRSEPVRPEPSSGSPKMDFGPGFSDRQRTWR